MSIRLAVATVLLAPLAAVASLATPAGAAPAPTVSVTVGAPGTRVDVSVAGCTADEDAGEFRFLQVLLISGTAPNEVLAGAASSLGGVGTLVVPDWVDAAQPAVIEATCQDFTLADDESDVVTTTYDAVAFDVLAGAGAPTQLTALSRTELAVGQGFEVDGSGCNLPGADFGGAAVFSGSDLAGRSAVESISEGDAGVSGGEFQAEVILSNGGIETSASGGSTDGGAFVFDELDVVEHPTDIAPGTYNVAPYCVDDDGVALLYQPKLITVTGEAPIGDLDLTVAPCTRTATFAGGSCTSGSVQVYVESEGWSYDPQAAVVEPVGATVPTTVVPVTAPAAPPAAAPAAAVPGRPNYAG